MAVMKIKPWVLQNVVALLPIDLEVEAIVYSHSLAHEWVAGAVSLGQTFEIASRGRFEEEPGTD